MSGDGKAEDEVLHAWLAYLEVDVERILLALAAVASLRTTEGEMGDLVAASNHYLSIYDYLNRS